MKEGCGRINKHTHSMKLIYKKNRTLSAIFLCISKKSSTFVVALVMCIASFFLQAHYNDGMWRSPVAQRSGGPEVASSNLVIPTNNMYDGGRMRVDKPSFFCYKSKRYGTTRKNGKFACDGEDNTMVRLHLCDV